MNEATPSLKSTMTTMGEALMESMAPLLTSGAMITTDEAKAWDEYVCEALRGALANYTTEESEANLDRDAGIITKIAVTIADKLLEERRTRFNANEFKKRLSQVITTVGKCGEPIGPMRCMLEQGHSGDHSAVVDQKISSGPT